MRVKMKHSTNWRKWSWWIMRRLSRRKGFLLPISSTWWRKSEIYWTCLKITLSIKSRRSWINSSNKSNDNSYFPLLDMIVWCDMILMRYDNLRRQVCHILYKIWDFWEHFQFHKSLIRCKAFCISIIRNLWLILSLILP